MDEGGCGWFMSRRWFDVPVYEEIFRGKILYRWGEGVSFDGFIE